MQPTRRDFQQRDQHEAAPMQQRMRQHEVGPPNGRGAAEDLAAVVEDIDVDGSWTIAPAASAPGTLLDDLRNTK